MNASHQYLVFSASPKTTDNTFTFLISLNQTVLSSQFSVKHFLNQHTETVFITVSLDTVVLF